MNMSVRFPNLGLEFEYVPVSVRVFGFEITFFGILLAVGMLLGMIFVVPVSYTHLYRACGGRTSQNHL